MFFCRITQLEIRNRNIKAVFVRFGTKEACIYILSDLESDACSLRAKLPKAIHGIITPVPFCCSVTDRQCMLFVDVSSGVSITVPENWQILVSLPLYCIVSPSLLLLKHKCLKKGRF